MSAFFDYNDCYKYCREFVKKQMRAFTFEDVKSAYLSTRKPLPNNSNVWGKMSVEMKQKGLIFEHGTQTAKMPDARGRLIRTWISKEYRAKQQANATKDVTLNLFEQ